MRLFACVSAGLFISMVSLFFSHCIMDSLSLFPFFALFMFPFRKECLFECIFCISGFRILFCGQKPDRRLCTSNEGRFFFLKFRILAVLLDLGHQCKWNVWYQKVWKQKRRLLKLFEIFIQSNFRSIPSLEVQRVGSGFWQKTGSETLL